MGEISIIHGIIMVEDVDLYKEAINAMDSDDNFPWVRPEMFNLCGEKWPYYYDTPVATFGATYKRLNGGVELSEFILKFEHFLQQIKFDFAKIRLETEFMGGFEFFWSIKRGNKDEFYAKKGLIESDKWFFGYGIRHMFGMLEEQNPKPPIDFQYPIAFNPKVKEVFNSSLPELNQLDIETKVYINDCPKLKVVFGNDHAHLVLTYLKINKIIRFGWESEKGLYIERLKAIKALSSYTAS